MAVITASRAFERALKLVALCLVLTLPSAFAATAVEPDALEAEPYGYFTPATTFPRAFANIGELHLSGAGEYGAEARPPYYGMLVTRGSRRAEFKVRERSIRGKAITFVTEALRGVSYTFAGEFARTDFHNGGVPMREVMLSGRMRKLKDGKEVAAARLGFFFEAGG